MVHIQMDMTAHEAVHRGQLPCPSVATGFHGPSERAYATHLLPAPPGPPPSSRLTRVNARAAAPRPHIAQKKNRPQHPGSWKVHGPGGRAASVFAFGPAEARIWVDFAFSPRLPLSLAIAGADFRSVCCILLA